MADEDAEAQQLKFRVPPDLLAAMKLAASQSNRSLSAEINITLEAVYLSEAEVPSMSKGKTLTVRLSDETRARLEAASKLGPYEISLTTIVERGIVLAAAELEKMAEARNVEA